MIQITAGDEDAADEDGAEDDTAPSFGPQGSWLQERGPVLCYRMYALNWVVIIRGPNLKSRHCDYDDDDSDEDDEMVFARKSETKMMSDNGDADDAGDYDDNEVDLRYDNADIDVVVG